MEPVEPVQMNIYQVSIYSWLHFDDELKVQEMQQMKDQQSFISVFELTKQFQVATRSTKPTLFHEWPYGRFIEIQNNFKRKKLHRMNQGSIFLGCNFSDRDNIRPPIQSRRERQPQHLKNDFTFKNRPIHFHINSTSVIKPVIFQH